jgi:SAM-dependent methyltransferase
VVPGPLRRRAARADVGYANAEPPYLAGLVALGAVELTGVDLANGEAPGIQGVVADVRELPFADGLFELAFCVSTLEHVGVDNSVYGIAAERDIDGQERALRELHRVLGRNGRLLVTVPAGANEDLGCQVQRSPTEWVGMFERAGFLVYENEVYESGEDGWHSTEALPAVSYGERGPAASGVLCAELRPCALGESLRLAVRDVFLRDEPRRSTLAAK